MRMVLPSIGSFFICFLSSILDGLARTKSSGAIDADTSSELCYGSIPHSLCVRLNPNYAVNVYYLDYMINFIYRQLVIKYARNRATLGEKFNHVDWEKLQNLPALLGAKLASLASLQSELQLFQIDVLRRETESKNKKKDTLEISTNEAKEKILELNLKLESVCVVYLNFHIRDQDIFIVLVSSFFSVDAMWFQEEMMKAKLEVASISKQLEEVLLGMLPAYYNHVQAFENTLVTKFFGLHFVKMTRPTQKKLYNTTRTISFSMVRFVKMGNFFCTEYAIHRCFDLKGSSHGLLTVKVEFQIDSTTTLKDLDLNFIFRLQKVWFQEFCRQVDRDCDFLEQERIMDYSLFVGVHFQEVSANADRSGDVSMPRISRDDMDLLFDPSGWASIRLGINMAAKAELNMRRSNFETQLMGDPTGQYYDVILFFGIIDILQNYDISKKLEHAYKAF
ncbi:Phosphatidylinositol 4-phosphate 5-kinase 4 [Capsicum annuum]|nr:Phosphatidylinositol 4-phosphate 5-kinase 4 [Capsicum annuum]KAF3665583.1 Phosphatidylinositol 4-phosphate 5-kinase 4 [Capsicum annuum]